MAMPTLTHPIDPSVVESYFASMQQDFQQRLVIYTGHHVGDASEDPIVIQRLIKIIEVAAADLVTIVRDEMHHNNGKSDVVAGAAAFMGADGPARRRLVGIAGSRMVRYLKTLNQYLIDHPLQFEPEPGHGLGHHEYLPFVLSTAFPPHF